MFISGLDKPIVAIDFDGTIKEGDWRDMSTGPVPGAFEGILRLKKMGCHLILWTSRTDSGLEQAMNWLYRYNMHRVFDSVNRNVPEVTFKTSNKVFADFYIDDASIGKLNWKKAVKTIERAIKNNNVHE